MPPAVRRRVLLAGITLLLGAVAVDVVWRGSTDPALDLRVHSAWHVLDLAFRPILVVLYALVEGALLARRHVRAGVFVVLSVLITVVVQVPLAHGDVAGVTALAGVSGVVAQMLVRRRHLRQVDHVLLALLVAVVALDRVVVGRHDVADILGGVLLGAGVVVTMLVAYSPLPKSHALHAAPLLESRPRGSKLAVVLNPVKVESVRSFRQIVSQLAEESGWDRPDWHYTTVEDSGTGMAAAAAEAGADLVLVCGGDGTVREVCAELAGTGIAVGIIPAGTGNLLARNLAIPLYLRAAVDVALNGQDRAIDIVEVGGDNLEDSHFLVMAGMGFDAAIMEGVDEGLKRRIGWMAYVVAGFRGMMYPAVRLDISVDDGPFTKHRARTVIVGNVGNLTAGMPLLPDAQIDDGLLDVVLLYPQRFLSWLPLAWRILTRRPHTDSLVNRLRGSSVVIRADRETPRELDGDPLGAGKELHMRCIHGRLLVRVPR